MLFARTMTLRNCGRFTVVESDFGGHYRTFTHVSSEALYASLTRGTTRRPHMFNGTQSQGAFSLFYDVEAMPVWFIPGLFVAEGSHYLSEDHLDTATFNAVHELYPGTSKNFQFDKKGNVVAKKHPRHVPTYGTIQALLPDHRMVTAGFSTSLDLLETFVENQTFLLGKKRTMFQIMELSPVAAGVSKQGVCTTGWLQLPPTYAARFHSYENPVVTQRYLIIRGKPRDAGAYVEFTFADTPLCLPDFYLEHVPIAGLSQEG